MNGQKHIVNPELALVAVAALWGLSFILISISLKSVSPALLMILRFGLGALGLALILRSKLLELTKKVWFAGFCLGTFIFLGYFLQVLGMKTIPSAISAFLTALYVPFVPLLQWIFLRKKPQPIVLGGILFAFIGMVLIIDPTNLSFTGSVGEWLTVLCAVACAAEIVVLSYFAQECDPIAFSFTQLTTVCIWSSLYCLVFEDTYFRPNPEFFICLAILVGMIAFNQVAMSWAQKYVPPTRAVLIYTLEPVFAGLIGFIVGEKIGVLAFVGGAIVVISLLVSSWLPKYLEERRSS